MSVLGGHFPGLARIPSSVLVRERAPQSVREVPTTVAAFLDRLAREHEMQREDLIGRSRAPSVVRVRHRAMAVLRWSTGLSFPEIGRIFNRDHATVIAAVRGYEDAIQAQPMP